MRRWAIAVVLAACRHPIMPEARSGADATSAGATSVPLDADGNARITGQVDGAEGDATDWYAIELPHGTASSVTITVGTDGDDEAALAALTIEAFDATIRPLPARFDLAPSLRSASLDDLRGRLYLKVSSRRAVDYVIAVHLARAVDDPDAPASRCNPAAPDADEPDCCPLFACNVHGFLYCRAQVLELDPQGDVTYVWLDRGSADGVYASDGAYVFDASGAQLQGRGATAMTLRLEDVEAHRTRWAIEVDRDHRDDAYRAARAEIYPPAACASGAVHHFR
jgi:hypothetical protein